MTTCEPPPTVLYDRKGKHYRITIPLTGEIIARPSRQETEAAYLKAVAPEVAERVARLSAAFPDLATRCQRAALIALAGRVIADTTSCASHSPVARVRSQSADGEYTLVKGRGQLACNCPDGDPYEPDEPGAPRSKFAEHTCKHILAYLLAAY